MRFANVLFLLFAIGCVKCVDEKVQAFRNHVKMLKKYPCGEPQPRVFAARDVIPKHIGEGEVHIKPVATVLHRCNNTGCCENQHERCTAADTETVNLTFYVVRNSVIKYLDVPLTNHTKCTCSYYQESYADL